MKEGPRKNVRFLLAYAAINILYLRIAPGIGEIYRGKVAFVHFKEVYSIPYKRGRNVTIKSHSDCGS